MDTGFDSKLKAYMKVITLLFISGRGLAIQSAKEGKSGFIYNKLFGPRKRAFHENPNRTH